MSRIDVVGQNGNDGLHYDKEWDQMKPVGYEYELDKSTGEVVKKYEKIFDYSPEFRFWYERVFCQSPRMCKLEYDDEKMWEAWKEGYKLGRNNAFKRKDCPPEIFTIPKEKHIHTMDKDKE